MNKGLYLVKQILKTVEQQTSSYCEPDSQDAKSPNLSSHTLPDFEKRLVMVKKQKNIYNRIFRLCPQLKTTHIYKLFGFMGINERSLVDPNFEESYFSTYFNGRVIQKVEYYHNAIVLEMAPASIPPNQPPVEYFIERNRSKNGKILFQLANQVSEVYQLFKTMPKQEKPSQKSESVKKCLDSLGDSMYICTLGINKVAVSKSLLNYLEYDLEQFGIQAIKYKTIFHEFFSANLYASNIVHLIRNLKHTVNLFQNKMTPTQFFKSTTLKFTDFIYSKSGVKSFCDMSFSMINPTFFCHKIDFIYYKENRTSNSSLGASSLRLAIEDEQERMRQKEYNLIKKVKHIPSHMFQENQKLIATYKQLQVEESQIPQESQ